MFITIIIIIIINSFLEKLLSPHPPEKFSRQKWEKHRTITLSQHQIITFFRTIWPRKETAGELHVVYL